MPRFDQTDEMGMHAIGGTHFQFSAKKIDTLGATEYTLALLVIDRSGSVGGYEHLINKAVQEVVKSCRRSPRADNLLLRVVTFDNLVDEFHGFKALMDCNEADYASVCQPRGATALYDATYNAVMSAVQYGKDLVDNDFAVNCALFVITDGEDNRSKVSRKMVADALDDARRSEALESIMPILIGVGCTADEQQGLGSYLQSFKDEAGFQQYVYIDRADEKKLAKLGGFISQSISSQSQALGTGGASKSLTF
jgi:uncharacterized protein YegL